jgi:hypothetical protein
MTVPTDDLPRSRLRDPELIEQLAAAEHERWSHWQRFLFAQCEQASDGSLVIPAELVRRWGRQMDSTYAALPEAEKASDREQVERYLPIVERALEDGS